MIAVDTNILARFYVDDPTDPEAVAQRPIARDVLQRADAVFVPVTVLLELEWVLRAFYGFDAASFSRVVEHLAGLGKVVVEDHQAVLEALARHRVGLDFADALHLTRSGSCEVLVTFDRRFAQRCAALEAQPPVELATGRARG